MRCSISNYWNKNPETANFEGKKTINDHSTRFVSGYMAFYMYRPTYRIAHNTAFVTPVVEHWLEREPARRVHQVGLTPRPTAPRAHDLPPSYAPFRLH